MISSPPVPVLDSSAATTHSALQTVPQAASSEARMTRAFGTAITCSGKLNGADRATANLKYYANEYHKANDESLLERRPRIEELIDCQSHNVFHIEDPCRTILSK